jgi:hypothetical protein
MDSLVNVGHEYVLRDAREMIPAIYYVWKQMGHVDPFVMIWPRKKVQWLGMTTNQSIGVDLPTDRSTWTKFLAEKALQYAAFALLLVEQKKDEVVMILESKAGTNSWCLPIENHGDVNVLGSPTERADAHSIGLLWRPTEKERPEGSPAA